MKHAQLSQLDKHILRQWAIAGSEEPQDFGIDSEFAERNGVSLETAWDAAYALPDKLKRKRLIED